MRCLTPAHTKSWARSELGRCRSVPPKETGIAVSSDVDEPVLLSLWMVEAPIGNGDRVVVQPIAVKQDGTRVPTVERLCFLCTRRGLFCMASRLFVVDATLTC